jgi:hypothetical protein
MTKEHKALRSGELSPERESQLKEKYPTLFKLEFEDKVAYLRKPDRATLKAAMSKVLTDPIGFAEVLLKNCWLDGDEEVKKNEEYIMGSVAPLNNIVNARTGELVKL